MATESMLQEMLESAVHFGHKTSKWNPLMKKFIYGERGGVHIIDLTITAKKLEEAMQFLAKGAAEGATILFVGTKPIAQQAIREEAIRAGMPYIDYRWLGGMLTNYKTIRQSIKRLKDLEAFIEAGKFEGLTKKEILSMTREKDKLQRSLGGIKEMGGLPDAIFAIDVAHEKIAINEARRLGIPIIGIVDTNNSPDNIDYIIPGNDDAIRAVRFYTKIIADVILEARKNFSTAAPEKAEQATASQGTAVKRKVVAAKKTGPEKPAVEEEIVAKQPDETSKDNGKKRITPGKTKSPIVKKAEGGPSAAHKATKTKHSAGKSAT